MYINEFMRESIFKNKNIRDSRLRNPTAMARCENTSGKGITFANSKGNEESPDRSGREIKAKCSGGFPHSRPEFPSTSSKRGTPQGGVSGTRRRVVVSAWFDLSRREMVQYMRQDPEASERWLRFTRYIGNLGSTRVFRQSVGPN